MSTLSREQVETAVSAYVDPYLGTDLGTAKCLKDVRIEGDKVEVEVVLGFPGKHHRGEVAAALEPLVTALDGVASARINVTSKITAHTVQQGVKRLSTVKNIIAIASGKGGVGKSTTAVNLALALRLEGASVGMLDADIYGPSQPRMLGISGQPESTDGQSLEPMTNHGIQAMSIGFLIEEETPMIWRGPMVTQALEQLLNDTRWKELDYLIIDLPPGTGDTQLTLAQKVPVSGAVIVTTPQDIALLDAHKGLKMFQKVEVPVLGVIENMSIHVCENCGHAQHIFGEGGGARMAEQYEVELLGELPLDIRIREQSDGGQPSVAADPDGPIARTYRDIALRMSARLSLQAKDHSAKFPSIVIQNT